MTDSTILFADIADSTELYEQYGDKQAESLVSQVLEALSAIVLNHHGRVIKTIGDEIMCQFSTPGEAIQAASKMHEYTVDGPATDPQNKISIRIGAHLGPVLQNQKDLYGDTVNVSSRITSLARPGKTVISEQTYQALPKALQRSCRLMMEKNLKGKELPVNLYDVVWEQHDQLTRIESTPRSLLKKHKLFLSYQDQQLELTQGVIKIGRDQTCDIVVDTTQVSRVHCEIRQKGSKFSLRDNSTNGTFILQNDVEFFFHQEEAPLHNSGIISLGQSAKSKHEYTIQFFIKSGKPH